MYDKNTSLFLTISNNPSLRGSTFYNQIFKNLKKNAIYLPVEIKNKLNFLNFLKLLKKKYLNFKGASVSMPFKEIAYSISDLNHSSSKKTLNANTIVLKKDKLISYNTDFMAINYLLSKYKFSKKTILILGAGGLAKSFFAFLKYYKGVDIYIYNRSKKRFNEIKKIHSFYKKINLVNLCNLKIDILINTIPLTDKNEIHDYINFDTIELIFESVISKKDTYLIKCAKKKQIKFYDGNDLYQNQQRFQREIYLNEI